MGSVTSEKTCCKNSWYFSSPNFSAIVVDDFKSKMTETTPKEAPTIQEQFNKPTPDQLNTLRQAEQMFINKQYLKCVEAFNKVAKQVKLDTKQSYYYGKALYNVSREYEKTLKYLEQAAVDKNTPYDVFYLLGKTNHYAYRFERAAKAYERYKTFASDTSPCYKTYPN